MPTALEREQNAIFLHRGDTCKYTGGFGDVSKSAVGHSLDLISKYDLVRGQAYLFANVAGNELVIPSENFDLDAIPGQSF